MKKRLLSLITVLAVLVFTSLTVFAETNSGNLTITGETLGSKRVTAVRMFTDDSLKTTEANPTDPHYVLEDAWKPFFADLLNMDENANDLSLRAYSYVVAMANDSEDLDEFAEQAKDFYLERSTKETTDPDYIDFTNPDGDAETNDRLVYFQNALNGTASFISLPAGSYVVFPESGSTSAERKTDAMFITIRGDVNKNLKSVYPSIEKTVQTIPEPNADDNFQDTTNAKVGDYVQFQLVSQVPEMSDYDSYIFNFKDTLSEGLTFVNDATHPLVVKIAYTATENEVEVTRYQTLNVVANEVGDYTVTVTPVDADDSDPENPVKAHTDLTVSMVDLKTLIETDDPDVLKPGQDIIVTYYAQINEDAVIGVEGNPNTAKVEYSNAPGTNGTGESEPDISKVYIYSIDIFKFTSDDGNNIPLANAKFKIKKTSDGSDYIGLIRIGNTGSSYRVATDEEIDAYNNATEQNPVDYTVVYEVTSPADGHIYISGLDLDTYYLEETEAPTGFNELADEIAVTLSMDDSTTQDVEDNPEEIYYTVDDTQNLNVNDNKVPVENRQGTVLPTTGGVGTIVLTIAGVVLVIIGIAIPVSKKKKKEN